MRVTWAGLILAAAGFLTACGNSSNVDTPTAAAPSDPTPAASTSTVFNRFPGIRTLPDITCPEDYLGSSGLIVSPPIDLGDYNVTTDGELASPEIATTLPRTVHLRGRSETYSADYYFAVREGRIYLKPNLEVTGLDEPWRALLMPRCLDGEVSEISADGLVLLALNAQRDIYTLDLGHEDIGISPWTRRWGPFFWTDLGASIPDDVRDWATSELHSGIDEYFIDGGGRPQKPWGILTVYLLRGDGRHITYLDPWLPVDDSREVCPPERGSVVMAGLSGSGSTVMVVTTAGEIYTRLHEFDVSGANSVLLDYAWRDQEGVDAPLIQLPGPDWIHHPRVPGTLTDRISLRKLSPGTEHRVMRVEGRDASGNDGYWQKDQADTAAGDWHFVVTGEPLQGRLLPLPQGTPDAPEDFLYSGSIDGHPAAVLGFNPYCSPTTLRVEIDGAPLNLELHTTDGLRQERRARGLDLYPRYYRDAIMVPHDLWDTREQLPAAQQAFLQQYFGDQRVLGGALLADLHQLQFSDPCWRFTRPVGDPLTALTQPPVPDAGVVLAELMAQQEEGRSPSLCLPIASLFASP